MEKRPFDIEVAIERIREAVRPYPQAAKQAGIGEATLRRWLQDPAFAAEYRACRRQLVEEAIGLMQIATKAAVFTLIQNLKCGKPSAEIRSAQVILEQALRGVELMNLEERLVAIEARLAAQESIE